MLKFENIAPGTRIKAYDFEPMPGRTDRYVCGIVKRHQWFNGAKFLVIDTDADTMAKYPKNSRIGKETFVPMEMCFDYEVRVQVLMDLGY